MKILYKMTALGSNLEQLLVLFYFYYCYYYYTNVNKKN